MHERAVGPCGMPIIPQDDPPLSRFEFWPAWLFYVPVWAWIICLMIRHRGIRLPLLANPSFPAGGLVGEEKSTLFELFSGPERNRLPPFVTLRQERGAFGKAEAALRNAGLSYPLVGKPDIGCRGAGVRPIRNRFDLADYLVQFPHGANLLLQQMVDAEGEAGIFFVREPGAQTGRIVSLTLKYFPYVVGDGRATLRELILADPRAGKIPHLYLERFAHELDEVVTLGTARRLVFAGTHSQGAIFRNGHDYITEALRARFDAIADGIEGFHFGRFDVRFDDFSALQRGEGFAILEFNGAGAEATHIWDSRTTLFEAWAALFEQFSILFRIGAANRARGAKPESWTTFFARWQREKVLRAAYPATR